MISLKNLRLGNFLSHIDSNLPIDKYNGLVLIEGQTVDGHYSSNGSGKSTLLEGIVYALTGDTLRGVSVNDVINRNAKKNTAVSLDFMRDGNLYSVNRYRKHKDHGDNIQLMRDGEDISKRVNKETQKSVDDVLGITFKVLVSTMLLGEGLSSRFTQLSDPDKKSLIESTLNLNYDLNALKTKARSIRSTQSLEKSNLEGRISAIKEYAEIDLESTKTLLADYEKKASESLSRLEELNTEMDKLKESRYVINDKLSVIESTIHRREKADTEINRLRRDIAEYQRLRDSVNDVAARCNVCHQSLMTSESRLAYKNNYDSLIIQTSKQIEELEDTVSTLPPMDVLKTHRDRLESEIKYVDLAIDKCHHPQQQALNDYWNYRSNADKIIESLSKYEECNTNIARLILETNSLSKSIDRYVYFEGLFSPTGIIVSILNDAVSYINERLAVYSEVLLEKDYKMEFVKGKISLVDSSGASYQSLSNGEKRRLDIAIQFSLHDYCMRYCGTGIDTMFIDEILDTLDDVGVENIITVLRMKLDYCNLSRIFIISHNSELKSYFDNVITVSKDMEGNSKLL